MYFTFSNVIVCENEYQICNVLVQYISSMNILRFNRTIAENYI